MKTWAISIMMLLAVLTTAQGSDPNLLLYDPLDSIETILVNEGEPSGVSFTEGMVGNGALVEGFIDYPYEGRFNRDAGTIQFLVRPQDLDFMGILEVGGLGYASSIGIFRFNRWDRQITAMEVRTDDEGYLQAWHDKTGLRLENGEWCLVTAVWRANQPPENEDFFQLYLCNLPGVKHTGDVCTPLLEPAVKHIRLGATGYYGDGRGVYDELRIYDYPKSHAEIDRDCRDYGGLPLVHLVHRFWSPVTKRHFYTISESEKRKLIDHYSRVWLYEDVAYCTVPDDGEANSLPVYRFWSDILSAHFYTISESEKDKLVNNYADVWTYEGIAWYAYEP